LNRGHQDFARVYDEHVWRVYGFLAYRLRDRDVAEDLTQTTFERALRAWSKFDPRKASELTWLIAIARNLLIDHHRRDRSDRNEPIDERHLPGVPGPEQRLSGTPELTEAMAQLRDRDREVLALRFGGDLSGPDIAVMMDLSLANVQQILSRSLRRLRTLLEASVASSQRVQEASAIGQSERMSRQWNPQLPALARRSHAPSGGSIQLR
jgi:RNA polymerase sigma factor (sigma-70 family)